MKLLYLILIACFVAVSCSSGRKALDQGNYREAISKAANRLSQDPKNKKAREVIEYGYPIAISYYQEEIDQMLTGNDPFKWNKTLSIMQQVNAISEEIRRIPAARRLVSSPKIYTSELADVTQRAAEEQYIAATALLERQNRDDAKQACRYLMRCDELVPGYKDVLVLMPQAKDLATTRIIVEPLPSPSMRYELTADFFYRELMSRMNAIYPQESFVNFYTPEEAEQSNLKHPDMVVKLAFVDFFIERPKHYEEERTLQRDIEEVYERKVTRDSVVTEKRIVPVKGKIRVITDEVASAGVVKLQVVDFQSDKLVLDNNLPGEFVWLNQYGIFIGDDRVLTPQEVKILNNKAVPPPGPQDMFQAFTQPIYAQLVDQMNRFFRRYN